MQPLAVHPDEVRHFFDAFVAAFATFDGALIARRYAPPYAVVDAAGAWRRLDSALEIASHFQDIVTQYHQRGCRSARFAALQVQPLGTHGALASVTWQLLRADASVLDAWRESYTLVRGAPGGRLHIVASIDHGAASHAA